MNNVYNILSNPQIFLVLLIYGIYFDNLEDNIQQILL